MPILPIDDGSTVVVVGTANDRVWTADLTRNKAGEIAWLEPTDRGGGVSAIEISADHVVIDRLIRRPDDSLQQSLILYGRDDGEVVDTLEEPSAPYWHADHLALAAWEGRLVAGLAGGCQTRIFSELKLGTLSVDYDLPCVPGSTGGPFRLRATNDESALIGYTPNGSWLTVLQPADGVLRTVFSESVGPSGPSAAIGVGTKVFAVPLGSDSEQLGLFALEDGSPETLGTVDVGAAPLQIEVDPSDRSVLVLGSEVVLVSVAELSIIGRWPAPQYDPPAENPAAARRCFVSNESWWCVLVGWSLEAAGEPGQLETWTAKVGSEIQRSEHRSLGRFEDGRVISVRLEATEIK